MLQYVEFSEEKDYSNDPWIFSAYDQRWDKETLRQLKEEYGVVFMTKGDGVIPVMVSDKWGIVFGSEDDGTIQFARQFGQPVMHFDKYWAEYLIADLKEACNIAKIRKRGSANE